MLKLSNQTKGKKEDIVTRVFGQERKGVVFKRLVRFTFPYTKRRRNSQRGKQKKRSE